MECLIVKKMKIQAGEGETLYGPSPPNEEGAISNSGPVIVVSAVSVCPI